MDTLEPITPEQKPGKVIDVKHRFAKKDLMIDTFGNQRLGLKRLYSEGNFRLIQ
jgi:hypothetical protein